MNNMMKRYLDSNVFLYPLLYGGDKAKGAIEILRGFLDKEFIAYTSLLTWDEFVYVLRKEKGKDIAGEESKKFLNLPNLVFLDVKRDILFKAQELISEHNLRPRDAIHAASAILNGINEIISDDEDFDRLKELKRVKLEEYKKENG